MPRTFHFSPLSSPRLKKLLRFLRSRRARGATTLEITRCCETTRASSDISELRANGIAIADRYEGKTDSGRKVFRYILAATT